MTTSDSNSDATPDKYHVQIGDSKGAVVGTRSHVVQNFYNVPLESLIDPNRQHMLDRLLRIYRDLLDQSLKNMAWIDLGLSEKPDAVQNVTNLWLKIAQHEEHLLSPDTTIIQIYESGSRELLILGEPGAGKSTLLYTLAKHLVEKAQEDVRYPFPIILHLSSWDAKYPDLANWMGEQIAQNYDVPHQMIQDWIEHNHILPLLDGLDEVKNAAILPCIKEINLYHREHLNPLVVCSRKTEYEEAITQGLRLALQTAVIIRPLTQEQIEAFLGQANESLEVLRRALREQPDLLKMATTPLMLNILILTYQNTTLDDIIFIDNSQNMQQRIFSIYVQRMFAHHSISGHYTPEMTKQWLSYLASHMQHNPIFYIEHMQANDWLPDGRLKKFYYFLGTRLLAAFLGILVSLIVNNISGYTDPTYITFYGLLGGVLGYILSSKQSLSHSLSTQPFRNIWHIPRPRQSIRSIIICLIIMLGAGLSFRLYYGSLAGYNTKDWLHDWLVHGVGFGVCCILFDTFLVKSSNTHQHEKKRGPLNNLWHKFSTTDNLRNSLFVGILIGLCSGLTDLLSSPVLRNYSAGFFDGLGDFVSFFIITFFISLFLSEIKDTINPIEALTWSWKALIDLKHVRNAILVALATAIVQGSSYVSNDTVSLDILVGIIYGLGVGLGYWLIIGIKNGVSNTSSSVPDKDTQSSGHKRLFYGTLRKYHSVPNEGIRRSGRESLIYGIIAGCIGGIFEFMIISLTFLFVPRQILQTIMGLPVGLLTTLFFASMIGTSIALVLGLLNGGTAYFRHRLLHFLLWYHKKVPWNYPQFLDFAVEHIFLRKSGGSYWFAHPLLRDHFALLNNGTQDLPQPIAESLSVEICAVCGSQYRSEAKFCTQCGNLRRGSKTEQVHDDISSKPTNPL